MKKILIVMLMLFGARSIAQDRALNFDGNNDWVNLDPIANSMVGAQQEWSIEVEVQYDNDIMGPTDYGVIFAANESNGGNKFLIRAAGSWDNNFANKGVVVYTKVGGANLYMWGDIPVGDGLCHTISFTYKDSQCNLYVDGVLDKTANRYIEWRYTDRFSLGQEFDLGGVTSNWYTGSIDELRLWRVELSSDAVDPNPDVTDNLGIELIGNEYGLFGYFNFNQGTAGMNNSGFTNLPNYFQWGGDGTLNLFALDGPVSNWVIDACNCENDGALNLDGINDYVNLNSLSGTMNNIQGDFTVEFTTQFSGGSVNPQYEPFFALNQSDGANRFIIRHGGPWDQTVVPGGVAGAANSIVVYNFNSTPGISQPNQYIRAAIPVDDGVCHHVAVTSFLGSTRIYIDGVLAASGNLTIGFNSTDQVSLGQEYDVSINFPNGQPSDWFNGTLDEIRIWSEVRSAAEINEFMIGSVPPTTPNLAAYYNCDQGTPGGDNSGSQLLNSASANHGNFILMALNGTSSNIIVDPCCSGSPQTPPTTTIPPSSDGRRTGEDVGTAEFNEELNDINLDLPGVITFVENNSLTLSTYDFWENASILIYDMNGKIVMNETAYQTSQAKLDISNLNSGMFIAHIISNNKTYQSKFIKQ